MTSILAKSVLMEDYRSKIIKIAFNPLAKDDEECFAVQTPVHLKTRHWIPDISELFKAQFSSRNFINEYVQNNPEANGALIEKTISQLIAIKDKQLGVIILSSQLDISEVTEIFVRINSQGKRLDQADFAMSKIAADEKYGGNILRKTIDYFCHLSQEPSYYNHIVEYDKDFITTAYAQKLEWLKDYKEEIYAPKYNDMLRVSFMHIFRRGRLSELVSLLSGRDFVDRKYKEEIAEKSFIQLKEGIFNFINEYNFKQFIISIKSAGFISPKMLNSKMTLDFSYTLFLLLQSQNEVPKQEIKRFVQKWFVFSTLTSRYISSPEGQMDYDLRSIASKGFKTFFQEAENSMFSESYWDIALVQNLETSNISSPHWHIYVASLIFSSERSFLSSSTKVSDLVGTAGDVHHIFSKEYLKENGFNATTQYNQIANYVYLDTPVNIGIGKKPPSIYLTAALEQCRGKDLCIGTIKDEDLFWNSLEIHNIPKGTLIMEAKEYPEFLSQRRALMAQKIKSYYESL